MAKSPPEMTPAEFKLMKALWGIKQGTVADVRAEHNRRFGTQLAYTTVMTLLGRLALKSAVKVDKTRQPFLYRPAFQHESVLRHRLKRFVDTVFDGRADSLVLHLVENESLSLEELRDIERSIEAGEAAGQIADGAMFEPEAGQATTGLEAGDTADAEAPADGGSDGPNIPEGAAK